VAVVKPRRRPTIPAAGVVVGVDDAGHARHALEAAFEEASLRDTSLTAVHVWSSRDATAGYGWVELSAEEFEDQWQKANVRLSEALAGFASRYPDVPVHRRVVESTVVEGLLGEAQDAQLLVVGRHGRTRVGSLALGSVARRCLDAATCPVMVAPADQHATTRR
jgi:nucleotide-binding universal stress UspA family protein